MYLHTHICTYNLDLVPRFTTKIHEIQHTYNHNKHASYLPNSPSLINSELHVAWYYIKEEEEGMFTWANSRNLIIYRLRRVLWSSRFEI